MRALKISPDFSGYNSERFLHCWMSQKYEVTGFLKTVQGSSQCISHPPEKLKELSLSVCSVRGDVTGYLFVQFGLSVSSLRGLGFAELFYTFSSIAVKSETFKCKDHLK
jgi:hypothetical protein